MVARHRPQSSWCAGKVGSARGRKRKGASVRVCVSRGTGLGAERAEDKTVRLLRKCCVLWDELGAE